MFELVLRCPQNQLGPLSDALDTLDALSVSVEDADAHTDAEEALFGEPGMPAPQEGWQRSMVCALYNSQALAKDALTILQQQEFFALCCVLEIREVPEQDWVRLTQSQFAPVEITSEFWIVPSWHEPPAQARIVIKLDPGLAFGTGTHPTTRMCLRWIAQQQTLGRVLDYGCGSGILAIGTAKFGATDIDAVDIDQTAVQSTALNAKANLVSLHAGTPDMATGVYQTVLANILALPLKVLAPLLWSHVAPGGWLVLAGILARQADEIKIAYAPYCQLEITSQEDGWIRMTAQR